MKPMLESLAPFADQGAKFQIRSSGISGSNRALKVGKSEKEDVLRLLKPAAIHPPPTEQRGYLTNRRRDFHIVVLAVISETDSVPSTAQDKAKYISAERIHLPLNQNQRVFTSATLAVFRFLRIKLRACVQVSGYHADDLLRRFSPARIQPFSFVRTA